MEKELTGIFESVKRAADRAENSEEGEDQCLNALKQLKKFPVNYQLLVSTQIGKRLRQLTKHRSDKIKAFASDVVDVWKGIIVKETLKNKKDEATENGESAKAESTSTETNDVKVFKRSNSLKHEQDPNSKKLKVERATHSGKQDLDKSMKYEISSSIKKEKVEVLHKSSVTTPGHFQEEKTGKLEKKLASSSVGPPKLTSLVYCKDPLRDTVREILAEALSKVYGEVDDDELKERVKDCDPNRVSVMVESAMFEKWGKSTGPHKFKYRSIMFNIKDQNNPDFRRKVLLGEFVARTIVDLTPEEMASDERQYQNKQIKQKALFNSERAAAPKASTNEFTCGRCKKKETTYYQMQTRSADEPMTTYVTCVNCGNHWKFC